MFLFLSKLLPLFLYPLGLTCLLMVVALVLIWKRPRLAAGVIALGLGVLLLSSSSWVSGQLLKSLEWQSLPTTLPQADAIVVLGGCTRPPLQPRPGVDVTDAGDRVIYGAQLYRQGKAPYLVLSGGRIDWRQGGPPESSDMADLSQQLGVPATAILQDPTSFNTHENAVNVKKILQEKGLQRVLLVTTATHMPRSRLIFKHEGIDAIPAPTDFIMTYQPASETSEGSWQSVILDLIPDAERLGFTTRALKEYLGIAIYRLRGWL
ncbi:hypothetical protein BST81_14485 [Leptolyngbya sp. 'hensonii']|uniref:YdcF family protein n=1 Tax=Leptolyngbya sp. 'hensonii' TaxID=1922337 RepID=UPI00094F4CA2|nr:YdcF family protein [Leptolyngbya sp. 'hensonii']OLP17539.1 hypothetical protein BST81_14485 [Leptolyngbya sp. 'hensonii']